MQPVRLNTGTCVLRGIQGFGRDVHGGVFRVSEIGNEYFYLGYILNCAKILFMFPVLGRELPNTD